MSVVRHAVATRALLAIYLTLSLVACALLPLSWALAIAVEFAVVAAVVRSKPDRRLIVGLGILAAARLWFAASAAVEGSSSTSGLAGMPLSDLWSILSFGMVRAAFHWLEVRTPFELSLAIGLVVAATMFSRSRLWQGAALGVLVVPLILLAPAPDVPHQPSTADMKRWLGMSPVTIPPAEKAQIAAVPDLPSDGRVKRVVLVVLESVGAANVVGHLDANPDDPFARLVRRGHFFRNVVAVSNASHMAQPGIVAGQDFLQTFGPAFAVPTDPHVQWSFPRHFARKGWSTSLLSSQDERWLGMSRVTLAEPWTRASFSLGLPDGDTYHDACGTRKAYDSGTVRRFVELVSTQAEPFFVYLNLQNTHYPYIIESPGAELPTLTCGEFPSLPDGKLDEVRTRYRATLTQTLDRLAALITSMPETLWVMTGDHPENIVAGPGFGHGKSASREETTSFAIFLGPQVRPAVTDEPISSVDLLPTVVSLVRPEDAALLPRDLLEGVDVIAQMPPLAITSTSGMNAPEYAAESIDARVRLSQNGLRCEVGSRAACDKLQKALAFWHSCTEAFARDRASHYNPCLRLSRKMFASDDHPSSSTHD